MDRREFLRLAALAAGAVTGMPGFLARAAREATGENTLVVIQLTGGNDGLNTVVPFGDPAYYQLRPEIGVARSTVLPRVRQGRPAPQPGQAQGALQP